MLASKDKIKQRHVGGPDVRVARWGWSHSGTNCGLRDIFHITPLWIGRPNEAFSIIGIFNRRKTKTQVRLNILLKENATGKVTMSRGMGEIDTKISAMGLQIEEDGVPFSNSELGGALRKAIDEATANLI